jgi:hypothetical protein
MRRVRRFCPSAAIPAKVIADEPDAALGNGGLGRLAACFLESLSTLGVPAHGYGIRYEHGLFRQRIVDGRQVELPETWLQEPHAWEFERPETRYRIGFGGTSNGSRWEPGEAVMAAAYDTPVVGWNAGWANTLRLWAAHSVEGFDLDSFNRGDFVGAATREEVARTISRVLYPDDTTPTGKELRLKQEYFFTAASLADILRRFMDEHGDLRRLPRRSRSSSTTRTPPSPGRNWCGFCMTSTASPSTRRWRSRAARCPTPTTRFCPRRWSAGRRTCSAASCHVTWRSWTASTTPMPRPTPRARPRSASPAW